MAAANKSWLYPEEEIRLCRWDSFGEDYLFMPDPRSMAFSGEIVIGYENDRMDFFDAYGRKPWQSDYDDKTEHDQEWETFHAFQGEFARRFGPRRRGLSFEFDKLTDEEDTEDFHKYHLSLEHKYKKYQHKFRRSSRWTTCHEGYGADVY